MFLDLDAVWGPAPVYGPPAIYLSDRFDIPVLVDEIDYEWARRWKWSPVSSAGKLDFKALITGVKKRGFDPNRIYARRNFKIGARSTNVYLHVEICRRAYGPAPGPRMVGDHKNGDTLDCRRANLHWASLSQNAKNLYGSQWLQTRMGL